MLTIEGGAARLPRRPRRRRLRRLRGKGAGALDLLAVLAMLVLAGLGVLNLYAIGGESLALHQLATVAAGLVVFTVLWRIRPRLMNVLGWICYATAVLALAAVLVAGVLVFGARRWLAIGSLTFQPSELAKLGLLLALAAVLTWSRPAWQRLVIAVGLAAVPIALVALEPDLSTASLLLALTVAMLIIGRIPARLLVPLFGGAALLVPLAVHLLRPYQLERLHGFTAGAESTTGTGYAVHQAHIAVASGGLFGQSREPLHGLLAEYLPAHDTDFALASLIQQWGFVAGAVAVLAALILVWRLALASRVPRSPAGRLFCAGLAVLIGIETVVSLGGNLGLLPVAGVPFPVLSYGGTAGVVHLAALGIALGARRDGARRRLWAPAPQRARAPRMARLVVVGLTALLVVFSIYAWRLERGQGPELRATGQSQMTRCFALPAPRGTITDRHGAVLAGDVATEQVVGIPALVGQNPHSQARLAALTGRPVARVRAALAHAPATALTALVATVPGATARRVSAAAIPGVYVTPLPRRVYPTGPLLAPVLGFVGVATPADLSKWPDLSAAGFVGRAGIEQEYDAILRGVDGRQCVYVDPAGVPAALGAYTAPIPGASLRLSIDVGLQRALTSELASALAAERNRREAIAAATALDPRTGQVLAMASLPSYDNNLYGPPINQAALLRASQAPGAPMLEHATQAVAPPGSTFKLVVASANMRHRAIPVDEVIPTGGSYTLFGHTFHNWTTLGPQNLVQAIAWSNDVYFYKLAWALGPNNMIETARALGVGQPTGIDLPGENPGYLGTPDSVYRIRSTWYAGSTVLLGIGQGYLDVTPLQDARWTAAVATGRLVTPRLGLATGPAAGPYVALPGAPSVRLPFAGQLGPVRDGMRAAVTGGTATVLSGLPVPVGAKTGTAEDSAAPPGTNDDWMTAAAPMSNPRIVVTALVQNSGEGATRAGPVVEKALRYYLAHQAAITPTAAAEHP